MPDAKRRLPRIDLPLDGRIVALVCVAYLLAGLTGHAPWKTDDAIHIDVAYGMARGQWLLPQLAGEPWFGAPPLYFWLAAALGQLFGGLLDWHAAARLATLIFAGLALRTLVLAAQEANGKEGASVAALLAVGTIGLIVPFHEAQPATTALLAAALALRGYGLLPSAPIRGGLRLGTALVVGFLGSGIDTALILVVASLLVWLHPHWRQAHGGRGWLLAAAIGIAAGGIWPALVYANDPHWFQAWWQSEAGTMLKRGTPGATHLEMLLWSTWPVLPLTLWTLWASRGRLHPSRFAPGILALVALVHFLGTPAHASEVIPALAPLILLAHAGLPSLRRGAANALDWFGIMTFSLAGGLIWLGGIAMLSGWPARVAKNFTRPAPGFVPEISALLIGGALLATAAWVWVILGTRRSPWRVATRWALGLVALWTLLSTLLLQWVDYGKSYASTVQQLRSALPEQPGCIHGERLGQGQKAVLDYHGGLRTVAKGRCRWLLVQAEPKENARREGWTLVRDAHRPGDRTERLRLYRREDN